MTGRKIAFKTARLGLLLLVGGLALSSAATAQTLTMWLGYPEHQPLYEQVAEDFREIHPDFELEITPMPLRESERRIAVALPAGSGPDLMFMGTTIALPFLEAGGMVDTDPPQEFVEQVEENVDERILEYARYDGEIVYAPIVQSGKLLYWNRTMFEEAGLPGPPTNYEEVVDYARQLAQYDEDGNLTRSGVSLRLSGQGSGVAEKWLIWAQPLGANLIVETDDGWVNGYDNEAGRQALQMYIDFLYKYNVDSYDVRHDAEAFALEQTAMFERESYVIQYMQENAPEVDYGVTYLPRGERWGTMSAGVGGLYVSAESPNKELAWEFLTFLLQPEYAELMIREVGWTPAFRKNLDVEEILEIEPKLEAELVYPEGYEVWFNPKVLPYDEILTRLADRLVRLYRDESLVDNPEGIAQAISEAAAETDEILMEYGLYGGDDQ